MPRVPDDDLTLAPGDATSPVTPASHRFAPGAVVAGRYRLVALLGRGGMGEVYRADDLTLDQPVALKFLPVMDADGDTAAARAGHVSARLAQFHNELRIARQVSHKNVCRLYDLGEADGRRFLTMEYVDGEDLASLLRRIGRLPPDKAVEIARQLCAGLAAAHERGVLHRDLKPANVMIDGDGNVRIADFGLAIADSAGAAEVPRAGTPQYMAPEQLAGQPASVKSDIYALGLVLFEIFTGRRAYDAKTLRELVQLHESRTLTTPSSVVRDLDPAIERVILRCLERDPAQRPGSALAVAAALPGGDPLAAALAAGETPSPEMLAAAGEMEAVPVAVGVATVTAFLIVLLVFAALAPRASMAGLVPLDKPPDVLNDRVEQILAALGYQDPGVDRAFGFTIRPDYPRWVQETNRRPFWWESFRASTPPALLFWHRRSPRELVPDRLDGLVTSTDPPPTISGMATVIVDPSGRLVELHAVPPQVDPAADRPIEPNWKALFDAAGQDFAAFAPVTPEWNPRDFADARAAWEGPLAGRPDIRVRVEAAAYRGRPMSFYMVGPWTRPSRMQRAPRPTLEVIAQVFTSSIWLLGLAGAALIARRHLAANRADRRAAARVAMALMMARTVAWIASAHHFAAPDIELNSFGGVLLVIVFQGGALWVLYLALEPYARRFWPDGLLGSTRLLSGRVRDPRVGRDILAGVAVGAALIVTEVAHVWSAQALGTPLQPFFGVAVNTLAGPGHIVERWVSWGNDALISVLFVALVYVIFRLLLPRPWMAMLAGTALITAVSNGGTAVSGGWLEIVFVTMQTALIFAAIFRFGLLAVAVALFADDMVTAAPLTLHMSAWFATPSTLTLGCLVVMALFGFYASRAGQPLFGRRLELPRT